MNTTSFLKKALLVVIVVFFASCDKDYNEIGGDLIGGNNFDFNKASFSVQAYTQKTGAIQSNNLEVNPLGIYSDSNFGETNANFNTQVSLQAAVTSVGARPFIESVILTIPYFKDDFKTKVNADGSRTYVLDSIYGAANAKMKLSVYESGYFMRDADPLTGFQQQQQFFTDQNTLFDSNKIADRLNDSSDKSQNDEFFFSSTEEAVPVTDSITGAKSTKYIVPGMKLNLNKGYFKTRILDAANEGKLASNNVFKNYFRGLYFKTEKIAGSTGNMAMLDFKKGQIAIVYKQDVASPTGGAPTREKKTLILDLSGNSVSLLNNDFSSAGTTYNSLPIKGNAAAGDEKVYLKGGEGSIAVLDLFDKTDIKGYDGQGNLTSGANGISDELDDLRNPADGKKILINEANLVFHIDAATMANSIEPQRVYLYDFKNSRPVVDYSDPSANNVDPKKSKLLFGGIIEKGVTSKRGTTYKIRITNQIRNLINNKDSTNVKLGLAVIEDIFRINSYKVRTPNADINSAPKASVMNPLGTILYGGSSTVPLEKRLKLEIYFTKPN